MWSQSSSGARRCRARGRAEPAPRGAAAALGRSAVAAEGAVADVRHQAAELRRAHVDQAHVVAALEIDVRLLLEPIVDDDVEPVGTADRRHRTELAVAEEPGDLLLRRQADGLIEILPHAAELDVTGRGQ